MAHRAVPLPPGPSSTLGPLLPPLLLPAPLLVQDPARQISEGVLEVLSIGQERFLETMQAVLRLP